MHLDLFRQRHPDSYALSAIGRYNYSSYHNRGIVALDAGLLQFTPDTAYRWAGPYEDGCAVYHLADHTDYRHWRTGHSLQQEWDELEQRAQRFEAVNGAPNKQDREVRASWPPWYSWWASWSSGFSGDPMPAKPFRLHVSGNDDTSYSKVYASEQEAREELSLMLACEPLHFHDDFMALGGWCFTN